MRGRLTILGILFLWLLATMGFWLFGFWQVPATTPDWFLRAQAVCFGTTETGMPDARGWIMLTLSPLLLLATVVVAYRREVFDALAFLYRAPLGKIIILLVTFGVSTEAAWVTSRIRDGRALAAAIYLDETDGELPEGYPRLSDPAHAFQLTDQFGQRSGPADFRGTPLILTFAFSHCKTICPAILSELKEASEKLGQRIPILVITLDPWRDREGQIAAMAKNWDFGPQSRMYTGSLEEIQRVLKEYRVPTIRDEQNGDITHPPMVYILDADGRLAYLFNRPSVSWITDAIARIEK
ncbi:MAG: SCO family protein [Kiritimatiellae bacterium]|nr:SCO family protein [Kiritimatiellia bacterium]